MYWGGWCPRLTPSDLSRWPASTAGYLDASYTAVESETGVQPATDFITGELNEVLRARFGQVLAGVADLDVGHAGGPIEVAPLAVQGQSPVSGLFSFDKFSSVPLLSDLIRRDVAASGVDDARRRLFVVPGTHVVRLHRQGDSVTAVEVHSGGQRHVLGLANGCTVVLAASAVESTRLAMESCPSPLMGRNLMAHIRSDFTVRIRRSALPTVPAHVQTAALLVRGATATGRFHLQVTASTSRAGSDELLFRMVPDMDALAGHLRNDDPAWITMTLRGIGEMSGDRGSTASPDDDTCWMNLSPFDFDEFGARRAYVHLAVSPADLATWKAMDTCAIALARAVAGADDNIEYLYDGGWRTGPFPLDRPFPEWHRGLGTTYHESGTLWMGDDAAQSVSDPTGRMHHMRNLYACDQSLFPTVGSVNPVLTGLTLARRVAESIPI